jgi:hypothetical protein
MKHFPSINEFSGRLNLSGVVNFEKSAITYDQFTKLYLNGEHEIYTERELATFSKAVLNELSKGEVSQEDFSAEMATLQQVKIEKSNTDGYITVFVREKPKSTDNLVKAETTEDAEEDNLEKGLIQDSFSSYNANKLAFTKTGKQIKDQINNTILPALNTQKTDLTTKLIAAGKLCGDDDPDQQVGSWYYKGFGKTLPMMMVYSYKMCEPEYDSYSKSYPEKTDDQKARQQYNELVYAVISTCGDIEYCSMLSRNLDDKTKFELTPDQLSGLQF